jgi:hypothetical protein
MPNKNELPESITWNAPSHKKHSHSVLWYLGYGLVSLGLIAFALYSHSIMTMITFILVIVVVLVISVQPVREKNYKLTRTGIVSESTIYPYKIIKKFWITYNPPEIKTLNFQTTAYLNNIIDIELGKQDPVAVKLFLAQYLFEDLNHEESFSATLARRLKI